MQTIPQSSAEHLSADDASLTPHQISLLNTQEERKLISPDDDSISDARFPLSHEEPSDAEIYSLGSDKCYNPDHFYPDGEEFKSDRPSTTSSLRSRSDTIPTKFENNKGDIQQHDIRHYV